MNTTNTLTEKGIWVWFGLIPFRVRPLVLAQIWAIGELVQQCEQLDIEGRFNAIEKMLSQHADIRVIQKVVVLAVFRSSVMRFLFGWYIRKHTTMERYKHVIEFCAQSFNAAFFFTSMSFLRGAHKTTMNTPGAQVHGDSLEE